MIETKNNKEVVIRRISNDGKGGNDPTKSETPN